MSSVRPAEVELRHPGQTPVRHTLPLHPTAYLGGMPTSDSEPEVSLRDRVIDVMAEAMRRASRGRVYEALEQKDFPEVEHSVGLVRSLDGESDRAVPIILFSYIDQLMYELFETELNPAIPGGTKSLLDGMGPLSTASARINTAQAFFWISNATGDSLRLLKSIRNEVAHNPFIRLDDEPLQSWIRSNEWLRESIKNTREKHDDGIWRDDEGREWIKVSTVDGLRDDRLQRTNRLDLVIGSVLTLHVAVIQMHVSPTALRMGVPPSEILSRSDEWPHRIRHFAESLGELLDAAFWQEAVAQGRAEA